MSCKVGKYSPTELYPRLNVDNFDEMQFIWFFVVVVAAAYAYDIMSKAACRTTSSHLHTLGIKSPWRIADSQ